MGRTCGEPDEIELSPMGGEIERLTTWYHSDAFSMSSLGRSANIPKFIGLLRPMVTRNLPVAAAHGLRIKDSGSGIVFFNSIVCLLRRDHQGPPVGARKRVRQSTRTRTQSWGLPALVRKRVQRGFAWL